MKKNERPTEPIPIDKVLREIYRHYPEYKTYVGNTGKHILDHSYYLYAEDQETVIGKVTCEFSFWDLNGSLKGLSKRKKEAFFYNIIMDMKQKDVADIMGITTVSIGQYVAFSALELSKTGIVDQKVEYF